MSDNLNEEVGAKTQPNFALKRGQSDPGDISEFIERGWPDDEKEQPQEDRESNLDAFNRVLISADTGIGDDLRKFLENPNPEPDIDLDSFYLENEFEKNDDDLWAHKGLPEAKNQFDPNKTQKTGAVKKEPIHIKSNILPTKPLQDQNFFTRNDNKDFKGFLALVTVILIFESIGWAIPTPIDNFIIEIGYFYFYKWLRDKDYDALKFLLKNKK